MNKTTMTLEQFNQWRAGSIGDVQPYDCYLQGIEDAHLAERDQPKTLGDFVRLPDQARVEIGQRVAGRVDEMRGEQAVKPCAYCGAVEPVEWVTPAPNKEGK